MFNKRECKVLDTSGTFSRDPGRSLINLCGIDSLIVELDSQK